MWRIRCRMIGIEDCGERVWILVMKVYRIKVYFLKEIVLIGCILL